MGAARLVLLVTFVLPLLPIACAANGSPAFVPGLSDAWASVPQPAASETSSARVSVRQEWAEVQQWRLVSSAPFKSGGHEPAQLVDIRANQVGHAMYAELVQETRFPDGSAIAELPHSGAGPGYLMRKTGTRWSYFQVDSHGSTPLGEASRCDRCHEQAPADHVFGLPRLSESPGGGQR